MASLFTASCFRAEGEIIVEAENLMDAKKVAAKQFGERENRKIYPEDISVKPKWD